MMFQKRPVVIEAHVYEPHKNCQFLRTWMGESDVRDCSNEDTDVPLAIDALEGQTWAQPGDWIIKGVAGEFYPCKPEIFAATYDPYPTVSDEVLP